MFYLDRGAQYKKRTTTVLILISMFVGFLVAVLPVGIAARLMLPILAFLAFVIVWLYRQDHHSAFNFPIRLLFLTTATLSVLWPRYIFFHLGGLPGFNFYTLCIFLCIPVGVSILIYSGVDWRSFKSYFTKGGAIAWLCVLWPIWAMTCSVLGEEPLYSTVEFFKESIYITSFIFFGVLITLFPGGTTCLLRCLIVVAFIVAALGVIESFIYKNLFIQFASTGGSIESQKLLQNILADKIRSGNYRIQSVFDHPIVFSQFISAILPLAAFSFIHDKNKIIKVISFLLLPMVLLAVVKSGSRSGFFSLAAAFACMAFVWWFRALKQGYFSRALALISLPAMIGACALAYFFLGELFAGRSQHEVSSTNTRLYMLESGIKALSESPIIGFGHGIAITKAGVTSFTGTATIDNYLLSIVLDYGLGGLLLFIAILTLYSVRSIKFSIQSSSAEGAFVGACCASLLAMFVTFSGLSINQNMTLFWLILTISLPILSGSRLNLTSSTQIK